MVHFQNAAVLEVDQLLFVLFMIDHMTEDGHSFLLIGFTMTLRLPTSKNPSEVFGAYIT